MRQLKKRWCARSIDAFTRAAGVLATRASKLPSMGVWTASPKVLSVSAFRPRA